MIRLVDGDQTTVLSERAVLFALLARVPLAEQQAFLQSVAHFQRQIDEAEAKGNDPMAELRVSRLARPDGNGVVGT
jgi:hypothetical protein